MEAYTVFAEVYDLFMDNIDHQQWAEYLEELLRDYGLEGGLVLDLGCGTGALTELLAKKGYDMIGVDNSLEMLEIAREKQISQGLDILYLLQDMREFELYGTVAAIVSCCDSLNYILEEEDLLQVFRLVNNYLDPGGVFLFDMNTEYKYREVLGENTIAENREEASFIWENYFDEGTGINEYDLTLYIRDGEDDRYGRFEETHFQRAYEPRLVRELLETAGLEFVGMLDAGTMKEPEANAQRIYFIARECTKKG